MKKQLNTVTNNKNYTSKKAKKVKKINKPYTAIHKLQMIAKKKDKTMKPYK